MDGGRWNGASLPLCFLSRVFSCVFRWAPPVVPPEWTAIEGKVGKGRFFLMCFFHTVVVPPWASTVEGTTGEVREEFRPPSGVPEAEVGVLSPWPGSSYIGRLGGEGAPPRGPPTAVVLDSPLLRDA